MSKLFVDEIVHQSSQGSGTITIGASGESISVPSGATLDLSNATQTGVGGVNTPAFRAYMGATQNLNDVTNTVVAYNTEAFDTDSAYDTSTYRFTVPSGKAGKYMFSLQAFPRASSVTTLYYTCLKIYKHGSQLLTSIHNNSANYAYGATPNVVIMDDASLGDYYEPYIFAYATTQVLIDTTDQGGCDHFNGYRLGS